MMQVCRNVSGNVTIGSIPTLPAVLIPHGSTTELCAPDRACEAANKDCIASVGRLQAEEDAKILMAVKQYASTAASAASNFCRPQLAN